MCRYGFQLRADHDWRARFQPDNPSRVLGRKACDCGGAMHFQRGEGFQISLNARVSAAIGAGDGQGDGHVGWMHLTKVRFNAA
jgi:hypothetical protein